MRRPMVAGNWKMNGSREGVSRLLSCLKSSMSTDCLAEIVVFPPYVYLEQANEVLQGTDIQIGAQNLSHQSNGAFTGEVSASMLQDFQCEYVIIGHSERRQFYAEKDADIAQKCLAALKAGLKPVICLGETLEQREAGDTLSIVLSQLESALSLSLLHPSLADIVIAYEPVWAIGTGKLATPEQAQEVHAALRQALSDINPSLASVVRILYGGSVKPENAVEIFKQQDVDGALVGGASLDAEKFLKIGHSF